MQYASTTFTTQAVAAELAEVVEFTAERLKAIPDETACVRPTPGKWSKKEIVGHLIDSAANNHQRFLRAQESDELVFPKYEQDHWVSAQHYNDMPWPEVVELWRLYNRHLSRIITHIPDEQLSVRCTIGPYDPVTLGFLIEDYLVHLKHHLRQVGV